MEVEFDIAGQYVQIERSLPGLADFFETLDLCRNPKVRGVDTSGFTEKMVRDGVTAAETARLGAERKAKDIQASLGSSLTIGSMIVVEYGGAVLTTSRMWSVSDLSSQMVNVYLGVCFRLRNAWTWWAPVLEKSFQLMDFEPGELRFILTQTNGRPSIPAFNPFSTYLDQLVSDPDALETFLGQGFEESVRGTLMQWHRSIPNLVDI